MLSSRKDKKSSLKTVSKADGRREFLIHLARCSCVPGSIGFVMWTLNRSEYVISNIEPIHRIALSGASISVAICISIALMVPMSVRRLRHIGLHKNWIVVWPVAVIVSMFLPGAWFSLTNLFLYGGLAFLCFTPGKK